MKIIIDVREEGLLEKCQEVMTNYGWTTTAKNIHLENRQLDLGDIIMQTDAGEPICMMERKTLYDLLASIQDGRYENQSYRLMHSMGDSIPRHNIVYLLEGMMGQIQTVDKKRRIYSSIASLVFIKGFSVFRTSSFQETADFIVCMADKLQRDLAKLPILMRSVAPVTEECVVDNVTTEQSITPIPIELNNTIKSYSSVVKKAKKENITIENIGEILLCQIPGISNVTAQSIMSNYTSFGEFIEELQKNPLLLDGLLIGGSTDGKKRHISKSCIENIKKYLLRTTNITSTSNDATTN